MACHSWQPAGRVRADKQPRGARVLERTLYSRVYGRPHLDHVLFSIGLVFMAVAAVDYAMGIAAGSKVVAVAAVVARTLRRAGRRGRPLPRVSDRRLRRARRHLAARGCARTRFGSRLRAASTDSRVARGPRHSGQSDLRDDVRHRLGTGGLGGALGAEILGLDPTFPLKFMIYFLIVVVVGGASSITGPLAAALILGIADVAGKYYVPKLGAFVIYTVMIAILIVRPQGLFAKPRDDGRGRRDAEATAHRRSLFWSLAFALVFVLPRYHLIGNEIAILALFALSLDLVLGYAGVVSLGHGVVLGSARTGRPVREAMGPPIRCRALPIAAAGGRDPGFATSFLVLRGSDLDAIAGDARIALLLGEIANRVAWTDRRRRRIAGHRDEAAMGISRSTARPNCLCVQSLCAVLAVSLARRIVDAPFGWSLRAIRDNPLRAQSVGIPVSRGWSPSTR